MKKYLIFIVILTCALAAFPVRAQLLSGDISMEVSPQNPKINQEVKVSLASYTIDLNQAKISWLLNNELVNAGIGKKTFSFTTDGQSAQKVVEAMIETVNGSVINKSVTITPNSVDLLWEAYNTYTPPFYRGKTLVPNEGMVKAVAVPTSNQILGYSYKWKQDANNKPDSSGYGKNSYIFKNSYLDSGNVVEVAVADLFGNSVGSGKLSLKTIDPKILFYKEDPELGILWEETLENGFVINKDGETIVAEPYFFSNKNLNTSDLSFKWSLNGEMIETPNPKNILSVKPESSSGDAVIELVINNIRTLFQKRNAKLNVSF